MRKLMTGLVAALACAVMAGGDLDNMSILYWQVDQYWGADMKADQPVYAMLGIRDDGGLSSYVEGVEMTPTGVGGNVGMEAYAKTDVTPYIGSGSSAPVQSFFIEAFGYGDGEEGLVSLGLIMDPVSYDTLVAKGWLYSSGEGPTSAAGVNVMHTSNVPEPTSGLLVLMGAALLALRRRNRKA